MTIKTIDHQKCRGCKTRINEKCPVVDSCAVDVLRYNEEGMPAIVYPGDCHSCFLCEADCHEFAVHVTPEISLPLLPY